MKSNFIWIEMFQDDFCCYSKASYTFLTLFSVSAKQEGESCGHCLCPPTYNAGTCDKGLKCEHDPLIVDAPGKCVREG